MAEEPTDGEIGQFLDDIKSDSEEMLKDLKEIDQKLSELEDNVAEKKIGSNEILEQIRDIRVKVGIMENVDARELKEEEIANSLLTKIRSWVDRFM